MTIITDKDDDDEGDPDDRNDEDDEDDGDGSAFLKFPKKFLKKKRRKS